MSERYFTVVILEEHEVSNIEVECDGGGAIQIVNARSSWDPQSVIEEGNPEIFFDEVARRLKAHWISKPVIDHRGSDDNFREVIITMPGTLKNDREIVSSSRLKIYQEFNVADFFGRQQIQARIVHDVEAMAWGEFLYLEEDIGLAIGESTLALILIDEGVGAKFIINGATYQGAGVAGTISRLVVQPEGAYFSKLLSRGNLEVYASRPWISRTVIENFNSLSEKTAAQSDPDTNRIAFDRKLSALSRDKTKWDQLSFKEIGEGLKIAHPCCRKAVALAEKYLGRTIHSVMTILNPHAIILTGDAITELPGFFGGITEIARDLSWPNCWNSCVIRESRGARDCQIYGAAKAGMRIYG